MRRGYAAPLKGCAAPRASGTLDAHYAPQTPVVIVPDIKLDVTLHQLHEAQRQVAVLHHRPIQSPVLASICLSDDAASYAQHLYASLRDLDQAGAQVIVVQAPPEGSDWHGVRDRLTRAAHDSLGILKRLLAAQNR